MNKQELIDKLRPAIAEEFELEEEKLALDAPIKELGAAGRPGLCIGF